MSLQPLTRRKLRSALSMPAAAQRLTIDRTLPRAAYKVAHRDHDDAFEGWAVATGSIGVRPSRRGGVARSNTVRTVSTPEDL